MRMIEVWHVEGDRTKLWGVYPTWAAALADLPDATLVKYWSITQACMPQAIQLLLS